MHGVNTAEAASELSSPTATWEKQQKCTNPMCSWEETPSCALVGQVLVLAGCMHLPGALDSPWQRIKIYMKLLARVARSFRLSKMSRQCSSLQLQSILGYAQASNISSVMEQFSLLGHKAGVVCLSWTLMKTNKVSIMFTHYFKTRGCLTWAVYALL